MIEEPKCRPSGPPEKPILTFYGDDFTGSTDVLEVLAMAGIPAVLFLTPPNKKNAGPFCGAASDRHRRTSRSQSQNGWTSICRLSSKA